MRQHFKFFITFCFLSPCFIQAQKPADCSKTFSKTSPAEDKPVPVQGKGVEPDQRMPLKEAQEFIQEWKIISKLDFYEWILASEFYEWILRNKDNLPENFPTNPPEFYGDEWPGWDAFLGLKKMNQWSKKDRLPLEEALLYLRSQGITNLQAFNKWSREGKRPDYIPSNPPNYYGKDWPGFLDLEEGITDRKHRKFKLSLDEAHLYMMSQGLKNKKDFDKWSREKKRPDFIPSNPRDYYGEEWKRKGGFRYFLSIEKLPYEDTEKLINIEKLPYKGTKEFIQLLGVETPQEYKLFAQTKPYSYFLPLHPQKTYPEFEGWEIFLMPYANFKPAQAFARKLKLNVWQFNDWLQSGERPPNFPERPHEYYKDEWPGLDAFLGIQRMPLEEAQEFIQGEGLISEKKFFEWVQNNKDDLPENFPVNPLIYYGSKWPGWKAFLGLDKSLVEEKTSQIKKDSSGKSFENSVEISSETVSETASGTSIETISETASGTSVETSAETISETASGTSIETSAETVSETVSGTSIETSAETISETASGTSIETSAETASGTSSEMQENKEYMEFKAAQDFAIKLGLNILQFNDWLRFGERPPNFPERPHEYYKEDWPGLTAFLGIRWMPLKEAQEFIQQYGLISSVEFYQWLRSNKEDLPKNFPTNPPAAYEKQWPGWDAFLGISSEGEVSDPSSKKSAENFSNTEKDLEKEFRKRPVDEEKHIL